ncbi:hypothetical protein Dsin_016266 [Dipteronia sinensis]|uniref:Transposase n=1 Tax=Dipteronia sinensis TaxID=43782 RepID=A0AAE0ACS4_9ROSI|nr:hypothetical protein Dsin_016266 [Dipteronia sinensis]
MEISRSPLMETNSIDGFVSIDGDNSIDGDQDIRHPSLSIGALKLFLFSFVYNQESSRGVIFWKAIEDMSYKGEMVKILRVIVLYGTQVLELCECDADHISLINLVHATTKEVTGRELVFRGYDAICFHIEKTHCPPSYTPHSPIDKPEVVEQLGWCNDEATTFDIAADSKGEDTESNEGDDVQSEEVLDVNHGMFDEFDLGLDGVEEEGVDLDNGVEDEGVKTGEGVNGVAGEGVNNGEEVSLYGVEDEGVQTGEGVQNEHKEEMRDIFREYAVREGVTLGRIKNDLLRHTYVCKSDGCPWMAHSARTIDKKSFMIKTLVDKHDCHRVYNNSEETVKWIAFKFESLVKSNPTVSVKLLGDLLLQSYKVAVDMKKLYNVKQRVMSQLQSDHNSSFSSFRYPRQYAYTLNQTNHGTTIHIKIQKPLTTFHGLFLSCQAQKQGFLKDHRPFIGLDGCHLKGPCDGVLLSAVALDANIGIFPLAVCICEKNTKWSWMWFLNNLKMFLLFPEGKHLCFISDRHKGLVKTLETHFPLASTRFCARHIYANFRSSYPSDNYKKMFCKASRSTNLFDFNDALDSIGEVDPRGKEWLQKIDPQYWSRFAYDKYIRCDHVTNNMTEAFNSMLGSQRAQTYLQLLEFIRRMVMRKLQERKRNVLLGGMSYHQE